MDVTLQAAAQRLRAGELVAFPTETVYGLGAAINRPHGLEQVFAVKGRPFFDPLIVHVDSLVAAKALVRSWPLVADQLAAAFWPGPLTLVLPKQSHVSSLITAGLDTVAVRCPAHPLAQELLALTGPLAAPSANRFGKTSPTTAAHVRAEFGEWLAILEGGPCEGGLESTVVVAADEGVQILRPGLVTREQIARVLGGGARIGTATSEKSPGHLPFHYQPEVELVLFDDERGVAEELNTLAQRLGRPARFLRVPLPASATLAARTLYADLRTLSRERPALLYAVLPERHKEGVWQAVRDRLDKAATYRYRYCDRHRRMTCHVSHLST
jgi:L-threonylcarbamoyladenylate synthase